MGGLAFALVVRFSLRPGCEQAFDELVSETLSLIEEREPGTLLYVVHEVEDDACGRVFYELYRDRAAFEEHNAQGHVQRFLAEREQYLAEPPRVELLNVRSGAGLAVAAVDRPLELAAIDDADALTASGEGEAVYEAVLQHLVGLVGKEIEVQVGVVTGSSPLATLSGRLWAAADLEWRGDDVLLFAVGEIINGFYIGREQFIRADAHAGLSEDGTLELVDADGGTLRIRDKTLDDE